MRSLDENAVLEAHCSTRTLLSFTLKFLHASNSHTACGTETACTYTKLLLPPVAPVALETLQVLERQKAWQQRWRERHEREGTLYDAVAVVEDVIIGRSLVITCIACAMLHDTTSTAALVVQDNTLTVYCRCIGATNKALAKRRAAEDALRIIAEKEAAVAAAAVAQQAAELQAAIGMPAQEDMAVDDAAFHEGCSPVDNANHGDKVADNAAAQEDMAVDNAITSAKVSDKGESLAILDAQN